MHPNIDRYNADKEHFIQLSGSESEQRIRRAFDNCLVYCCREHRAQAGLRRGLPPNVWRPPEPVCHEIRWPP